VFPNGDNFVGNFRKGQPHGLGKLICKDGSMYTGTFKNGKKEGKGKWNFARVVNNDTEVLQRAEYSGELQDNARCGTGKQTWSSGGTYEGSFKDDKRHGYGTMRWADGTFYQGDWFNGQVEGHGKIVYVDGFLQIGLFKDNILVKKCIEGYVGELKLE